MTDVVAFLTRRAAAVGCLAVALACGGRAVPPPDWTLVLRHAALVSGSGVASPGRATVAIRGDRIVGVYPEDDRGASPVDRALAVLSPRARSIDLSGRWLLPGFIDAHVHLFDSASLFTSPDDYDLRRIVPHEEERQRVRAALGTTLARYLCAGVTTAVSLGGPRWETEVRDLLRDNAATARIVSAGPFFGNFPVGEFTLWTPEDPVLIQLTGPEPVDAHLEALVRRRIGLVKIGLVSVPGSDPAAFAPVLSRFVERAHGRGLRVAAHAEELALAKLALEAGVDVLAHTVSDRVVDEDFLVQARSRAVVVTSGLSALDSYGRVLIGRMQLLPIESRCGDPVAIASWSRLGEIPARQRPRVPPVVARGSSAEGRRIVLENTRLMAQAGIPIAVGTNAGQIGSLHGGSFHRELQWLSLAGLSPADLVRAATLNGAQVVGDARRGDVAQGYLADLVVLEEDPLSGVDRLAAISGVVRSGVYWSAEELERLIGARPADP